MGEVLKQAVERNYAFWLLMVVAIALMIGGFLCPPLAVIDGSVLIAVGELTGFGGLYALIKAIDKGVDATFSHKDTTIKVDGKE